MDIAPDPIAPTLDDYVATARNLRAGKEYNAAERYLEEGQAAFPDVLALLVEAAELATARADWRSAAERWAAVAARMPQSARAYGAAGHALRHLNRCDDADALEQAGLAQMPGNLELLISNAWTAVVRGDPAAAAQRWQSVILSHPHSFHGYAGLAEVLHLQKQHEDADAVLRFACILLPRAAELAEIYALQATRREDWPAAVARWRQVRARGTPSAACLHQLGVALRHVGEAAEAETVLAEGMAAGAHYLPLALEHAWCANARHDWPTALDRWEAVARAFPSEPAVQEGLLSARLGAQATLDEPGEPPAAAADDDAGLLRQFQGLGETCEFGLVQRYFGLEPMSLFRWAATTPRGLAAAIGSDLAGIGSPVQTAVEIGNDAEYYVTDTRYGFVTHTFIPRDSIDLATVSAQQCRRLDYLARAFRKELAAGGKIYVFASDKPADEAALTGLAAAIASRSTSRLLWVSLADATHPPGSVVAHGGGLLAGRIDRFGGLANRRWDIAYRGWVDLCRAARTLAAQR